MTHRVAIFGGGVGGMTAAHELVRVGRDKVEVTVYERNPVVGGKARSMTKEVPGSPGKPLPGEHGFRFFPGYYQHVIRTMERIPYLAGGQTAKVVDNLVMAPETHFARTDGLALQVANHFPKSIDDIVNMVTFGGQVKIPVADVTRFARRLRDFMISCDARRYAQFDEESWFEFVGADKSESDDFTKYLADGLNQRTVAASGHDVSARTVALTLVRIMNDWLQPGKCIDRVLNGPTSERWLQPWYDHVDKLGATFVLDRTLVSLDWDDDAGIRQAVVQDGAGSTHVVEADSYVFAMPLADARKVFVASGLTEPGTGLEGVAPTATPPLMDDWMNGIQFYLDGPLDLAAGHTIFVDSSLSLTSIEQGQFWNDIDLSEYGDGTVKAILSVDISEFDPVNPGEKNPKAMTREELMEQTIAQVRAAVAASYPAQTMPNVIDWHLDPAIVERPEPLPNGERLENLEGLFINTKGSWVNRPPAVLRDVGGIGNAYIASDYAQTETDLATMEGANEAGRRSARGVLEQMGEPQAVRDQVELFDFPEPEPFRRLRQADDVLFHVLGDDGSAGPLSVDSLIESW